MDMQKHTQETPVIDPFRNRTGEFRRWGGSTTTVCITLDTKETEALGVNVGGHYWLRIAADNRSITIHLDNPNGNQKQASHAASKGR